MKTLILKDNYNSFEQYYLDEFRKCGIDSFFYYKNSTVIRKLCTHYGISCEILWYGKWKKHLSEYDCVIVFDSLHSSNLIRYIRKKFKKRLIFWHWNPIKTNNDLQILESTRDLCEHWTFDAKDASQYRMKLNNQFFFNQQCQKIEKRNSVFFVGTDKGRYNQILKVANLIKEKHLEVDFHVINKNITEIQPYIENSFMEYSEVLEHVKRAKAVLEIIQEGQSGLTIRPLEAMFFGTKLITNNADIVRYPFYSKDNIFIIGHDKENELLNFLNKPFMQIASNDLYTFSAEGWIEKFENYGHE